MRVVPKSQWRAGPRKSLDITLASGAVRYMPHVGVRTETLARHSLSQDFSSKLPGGGRVPRDALGTAQDASALSSGGSPCAPAAFLDETYLSHRLAEALAPAVVLDGPAGKTCVELFVEVLQGDGGVFAAAVAGASLALADAGVAMRDVVCAGSAAVIEVAGGGASSAKRNNGPGKEKKPEKALHRAIADPTEDEVLRASGVVTIAMMPSWREVTVWDQFGRMSLSASAEATELARDGCVTLQKFLRNCLVNGKGAGR